MKYPTLFKKWTKVINREIKSNQIKIAKKYYRSNVGTAWAWLNKIQIPKLIDVESLYVTFHEIAHIKYGHQSADYMEELE